MLFVGIDVASDKHDVTITDTNGVILSKSFTIENNRKGFKKLHMEIQSHTESLQVCIGMEITGIYYENIANYFFNLGYLVFTENANLIKSFIMSQTVRLTKTDSRDSFFIAKFYRLNFLELIPYTPKVYITNELKSLSRLRFDKNKFLSKSKTELKRLLMLHFPEFVKHFDPLSKWALSLLSKYKTKDAISRAHTNTLVSLIKTKGNRIENAALLKSIAKSSIGSSQSVFSLLIENTIDDIHHYQKQINSIETEMKLYMENFSHITSIPGVGFITGAVIIGEIGDISSFSHKSKLVAFAGCDPTIYESGKFKSKKSRISKRGSKYLRNAIFLATRVACVGKAKDNKFRHKYLTKIAQGKHHSSAVFSAAKNMLHTIYTMLKTGECFNYNS